MLFLLRKCPRSSGTTPEESKFYGMCSMRYVFSLDIYEFCTHSIKIIKQLYVGATQKMSHFRQSWPQWYLVLRRTVRRSAKLGLNYYQPPHLSQDLGWFLGLWMIPWTLNSSLDFGLSTEGLWIVLWTLNSSLNFGQVLDLWIVNPWTLFSYLALGQFLGLWIVLWTVL